MPRLTALLLPVALAVLTAGCDQLGIESSSVVAARREADGKAVGGACRHAARAIEDCYTLNRKADRAAVYAGWREMNEYMRENKVEAVLPQLGSESQVASRPATDAEADDAPAKPAAKADAKAADKPPAKGKKQAS